MSGVWDNDYQGDWSAGADEQTPPRSTPAEPPRRAPVLAQPRNSGQKLPAVPKRASPNLLLGAATVAGLLALGFYIADQSEKKGKRR